VATTRSGRGRQTRRLLFLGFGGLLILLAFTGLNALSVLRTIQQRNERIREDYVHREQILEQLRSDLYLSGTYARDLLLERDPALADVHRQELQGAEIRVQSMIRQYQTMLRNNERRPFSEFNKEVDAFFQMLQPVVQWSAAEREQSGYAFVHDYLLPRRMVIVRLADQIRLFNQHELEAGNQEISDLFSDFRMRLGVMLAVTVLVGIAVAGGSISRILRLERLSEQARTELRNLSDRLVEAQETERRAISRELHDEVGQAISAISLAIGNVAARVSADTIEQTKEELRSIRQISEKTVAVVRDMSLLLRPSMLDDLGLIPALEWQAREVSRNNDLRVVVHADAVSEDLPDEHKTCIYRVVQEALRNVTRHANAKTVEIGLGQNDGRLHLTIRDDGQGFRPERERGLGLLGMQERVRRLNGTFDVNSQPERGTTVSIVLPLTHA
jgi:signal transduction histidine kinase